MKLDDLSKAMRILEKLDGDWGDYCLGEGAHNLRYYWWKLRRLWALFDLSRDSYARERSGDRKVNRVIVLEVALRQFSMHSSRFYECQSSFLVCLDSFCSSKGFLVL